MKVTIEIFADFPEMGQSRVYRQTKELNSESEIRETVASIVMGFEKIYGEPIPMEAKIYLQSFTMKHNFPNEAQQ